MDDLDLLRLELETLWVTDEAGRVLHCRTDGQDPAPLLVVAACSTGTCWATSAEVPDGVEARVANLLSGEPPADSIGWAPTRAAALVGALAEVCELASPHGGPSYVVSSPLAAPSAIDLRSSAQTGASSLRGLMPEVDRLMTAPWVVAMVDGQVAAACETARSTASAVEAGVWTYEPHRRQGIGAAVTAAWSTLVEGRTAFYSTSWDNRASQGVAGHLGLRSIGHWWQLGAGDRPRS